MVTNRVLEALDHPPIRDIPLTYFNNYQQAFQLNPDYISRKLQANQETIRLAYVRTNGSPNSISRPTTASTGWATHRANPGMILAIMISRFGAWGWKCAFP